MQTVSPRVTECLHAGQSLFRDSSVVQSKMSAHQMISTQITLTTSAALAEELPDAPTLGSLLGAKPQTTHASFRSPGDTPARADRN